MTAKIRWTTFRQYRGPFIKGEIPFSLSEDRRESHVDRAFWLTSKVETGAKFGSVMAYDGTAMTAGLDQHIAVYPKELAHEDFNPKDDQGGLWQLLRQLECIGNDGQLDAAIKSLWDAFEEQGWYLAQDGLLRYLEDVSEQHSAGDIVFGHEIRDTLTPVKGKVEKKDEAVAERWIRLFHDVFEAPGGFSAQIEFGRSHLVERARRWGAEWPYGSREITVLKAGQNISLETDLALCMYHSHSVNAPAKAIKLLRRAGNRAHNAVNPKKLIKLLGTSKYGRWDDDIPNGRYQRTRAAARASGLWPRRFFDGPNAIMPGNLPG